MFSAARRPASRSQHSLVGDVAKYLVTRSVLKRVVRVGGIQGMLLSVAATYAMDRFMNRRR